MPIMITSSSTKITSLQAITAALLACGLSAAPAQAGPNRTFVSGTGTDSGTCARTVPCRTFAFALTQTAAGGEIDVLDPAGYGTVTINHAISIVNDGVGVAGVTAKTGVNPVGVLISAGAGDSVHLRGLTIDGPGTTVGSNGIAFGSGGNLAIENCVVRNFQTGIFIAPITTSSFSVSNTIASNNGAGISVQPSGSAVVTGVLRKIIADNNNAGIVAEGKFATGALNVVIADSETSNNNSGQGVFADSVSGAAPTSILVRNVVSRFNAVGLLADANSTLRVAHSVVTGNITGVNTSGGTIFSYGDNDVNGNTTDNTGVLTTIP
ncbi:MAG TPA: right-handed parallel beta-helix repeat-containing protein, partial [Methylocella sp.]|nr:right-handed parallel beta-helix repeat-containing protein [Methylocella sp.]